MSNIILHHYELSPFSEKIRRMLAYCKLPWKSSLTPPLPPRATVDPLAGGYRRIPIMQIGADIFCDTKIISSEIADLINKPELALENGSSELKDFVNYLDSNVFMAIVTTIPPTKAIAVLLKHYSFWQTLRFIKDRAGIGNTSSSKSVSISKSKKIVSEFLNDVETRLMSTPYLFGKEPSIADFSAYHLIWFKNKFINDDYLSQHTNLKSWLEQMRRFDHDGRTEIDSSEVFSIASNNTPRKIPSHMTRDCLIGTRVEIKPNDYAQNAVIGKLVGISDLRWIVSREHKKLGNLHIHFPKEGYELISGL